MTPHPHTDPPRSLKSMPEPQVPLSPWLMENGLRELQALFRAVVFHPSSPILIADDDRNYQEASVGAGKLLGLQRENIIGRRLDDFLAPSPSPILQERWQQFLKDGDQVGTLQLLRPDGTSYDVEYRARGNVLPVRHLLLLKDKLPSSGGGITAEEIPKWAQDYALCLLDAHGCVVAWYGGAERMYGYKAQEVLGVDLSFFYPPEDRLLVRLERKLLRAVREGHAASEAWHSRKDGSRFWANSVSMALHDEAGILQGYARVVRDFTDRHERDEALDSRRGGTPAADADQSTIAGVASGEFDRIAEMNDPLLELLGYTREELLAGLIVWATLTPKEYAASDEFAHEEGLRFGASSPFEKELLRKDGTRVRVRVATAVLKLSLSLDHLRNRSAVRTCPGGASRFPCPGAEAELSGDRRLQPRSQTGTRSGGTRRTHGRHRSGAGRNRNRQGTHSSRNPSAQPPPQFPLRQRELRRHSHRPP